MTSHHPFAIAGRLSPDLTRVRAYWEGLLRGEAKMPFADDLKPTDLPDLGDRLFLVEVFDRPTRFRVGFVGRDLAMDDAAGRFLDEARFGHPFDFLAAQCEATVESAQPTYFRDEDGAKAWARLLLPFWGEGRVSLLLGAVDLD
jgi:hypothetical protein